MYEEHENGISAINNQQRSSNSQTRTNELLEQATDPFALRRQLQNETKEALTTRIAEANTVVAAATTTVVASPQVYVTEWYDDANGRLVGVGCLDEAHEHRTVRLTLDISPGLFAVTADPELLHEICSAIGDYRLVVYNKLSFYSNNFALQDLLHDPTLCYSQVRLVKIIVPNFKETVRLFWRFKKDPRAYRYINIFHYWDATKQIFFELFIRENAARHDRTNNNYTLPRTIFRWFDARLRTYDSQPAPHIPFITFDIETVSTDANRVPTGEDSDDVLFTTAIHHSLDNTLYTLVFLPILNENVPILQQQQPQQHHHQSNNRYDDSSSSSSSNSYRRRRHSSSLTSSIIANTTTATTNSIKKKRYSDGSSGGFNIYQHQTENENIAEIQRLMERRVSALRLRAHMLAIDKYPTYPSVEKHRVEVFVREIDLLKRTMDLLRLPHDRLHYLIGYNSLQYDIKYLLLRSIYFGLHKDAFVWKDGYCFGFSQIHLDMFRIAMMRYNFKKYTLNEVSRNLLKINKVDVSAVDLRYTFHQMAKYQKLYTHEEWSRDTTWPSLRDALHYNNRDTLLVSELIARTQTIEFIRDYAAQTCYVSLSSMNINYNQIQFRILNEAFVNGLAIGMFLSTFKDASQAHLIVPVDNSDARENDDGTNAINLNYIETVIDTEKDLLNSEITLAHRSRQYYDEDAHKRAAQQRQKKKYPGGANFCLGEYDVNNVQAYDYRIAYPLMFSRGDFSDETCGIYSAALLLGMYTNEVGAMARAGEFVSYDYLTHTGKSKTETRILYYRYFYKNAYCGGEFPFTRAELRKRGTSLVILRWTRANRPGVLSAIIARFNYNRENTKIRRKTLDGVLERLANVAEEYATLAALQEEEEAAAAAAAFETSSNVNETTICGNNCQTIESTTTNPEDDFGCSDDEESTAAAMDMETVTTTTTLLEDGDFGCDDDDFKCEDDTSEKKNDPVEEHQSDFGCESETEERENDGLGQTVDEDDNFGCDDTDDEARGNGVDGNEGGRGDHDDEEFGCDDDSLPVEEQKSVELRDVLQGEEHEHSGSGQNKWQQQSSTGQSDQLGDGRIVKTPPTIATRSKFFSFEDDILQVQENGLCEIDEARLRARCNNDARLILNALREYTRLVSMERDELESSYRLQKTRVASIYGCVGALKPELAALITCMVRSTLLKAGQYLVQRHNCQVYYADTDSLFITNPTGRDMSVELNALFPWTQIEMKQHERILFVRTKTYYYWSEDGSLKYGQNVNGPLAWRDIVSYFVEQDRVVTTDDIYTAFVGWFVYSYGEVFRRMHQNVTDGLEYLIQDIKVKNSYETMTPCADLKRYLVERYPALAGAFRQRIYYYYVTDDVLKTVYRPSIDLLKLTDDENEDSITNARIRETLRCVNLFKYYYKMMKTVFNLLKFHVRRNNSPFHVSLNDHYVRLLMLRAFLAVYDFLFYTIPAHLLDRQPEDCDNDDATNAGSSTDEIAYMARLTRRLFRQNDTDTANVLTRLIVQLDMNIMKNTQRSASSSLMQFYKNYLKTTSSDGDGGVDGKQANRITPSSVDLNSILNVIQSFMRNNLSNDIADDDDDENYTCF